MRWWRSPGSDAVVEGAGERGDRGRGGGHGVEEVATVGRLRRGRGERIPRYECGKGGNCKMGMKVRELLETLQ
jgi:hypothetical protein